MRTWCTCACLPEGHTALVDHNQLLSPYQYGFRSGRSVSDQLLFTYDYVTDYYDQGFSVDVIFFDFKKAFDVYNHRLLFRISSTGVEGCLLGWPSDYLTGREMKVAVHDCELSS